jgi:hypothetical protein
MSGASEGFTTEENLKPSDFLPKDNCDLNISFERSRATIKSKAPNLKIHVILSFKDMEANHLFGRKQHQPNLLKASQLSLTR